MLYPNVAGMATASAAAVAISASPTPGATADRLPDPLRRDAEKRVDDAEHRAEQPDERADRADRREPRQEATDADRARRTRRCRATDAASRSASRSASPRTERRQAHRASRARAPADSRRARPRRNCIARKNSRGSALGVRRFVSAAASSRRSRALEVARELRRAVLRLRQRPPDAEHDRPAQQREAGEQHQDPLRHGRGVHHQLDRTGGHGSARGLQQQRSEESQHDRMGKSSEFS